MSRILKEPNNMIMQTPKAISCNSLVSILYQYIRWKTQNSTKQNLEYDNKI